MEEIKMGNRFLYFLEGIACISVIFIHCMFPSWLGILICGLARFAVPLFFLISGYYLYQPDVNYSQIRKRIQRKILHIGILLIISIFLYLCWILIRTFLNAGGEAVLFCVYECIQPRQFFSMLILNDFNAIGGHLWFLAALLYCYIISLFVDFESPTRLIYLGIPILLGIHVLGRIILCLLGVANIQGVPVYIYFRNWLFMAWPFFVAGNWIRHKQNQLLLQFSKKKLKFLFMSGVVLTMVEGIFIYQMTGDDRELYIGTFLMVFSIFLYALQMPEQIGILWIENVGRRYLIFIYIVHLAVIEGVSILLHAAGVDGIRLIAYIKPIVVVGVTIIGAVLWDKVYCYRVKKKDLYVRNFS